jgi:hypothetical protein
LPVAVEQDAEKYLAGRRAALNVELERVARLADAGELQDVDLANGALKITPLVAAAPDSARMLKARADALLPRVRITDLLVEIDAWTGFSECFVHRRSGRPAENRRALLTAILADGTNLGLTRTADVCEGATLPPVFTDLARLGHDTSSEMIRHVAPLGWQHIALTGDYTWNLAETAASETLRPLRTGASMLAA